ncbi:hypothetical protein DER46DRAFT_588503 [Fusarium sp. MPI-SDFR-AT-0072]|nr:hypothetical protein DER46DRAFT_588503 [Fusarium sp. MPI-SDFR-AT-0072]
MPWIMDSVAHTVSFHFLLWHPFSGFSSAQSIKVDRINATPLASKCSVGLLVYSECGSAPRRTNNSGQQHSQIRTNG